MELENWLFDLPLSERQLSIMNLMVRLIGLASTDPGFVTHNLNRYINQEIPVSKVFPDKQQQQEMYGKLLEMFPESKQGMFHLTFSILSEKFLVVFVYRSIPDRAITRGPRMFDWNEFICCDNIANIRGAKDARRQRHADAGDQRSSSRRQYPTAPSLFPLFNSQSIHICLHLHTPILFPTEITAMYETGSFANHSCDPNVGLRSPSVTSEVLWVAFKPIRKGEEILCSYIPTDLSTADRKEILLRSYGFECKCSRCSSPNH